MSLNRAAIFVFACLLLSNFSFAAKPDGRTRLPLTFEANQGQAADDARFVARSDRETVSLTNDGLVLKTATADTAKLIRMHLVDSLRANAVGEYATGGFANYYSVDGSQNFTHIPLFSRVRYAGIYPGVDAVFHGRQGELEYDFELAPGSSPANIALAFEGAERIEIVGDGDLSIVSGTETWRFLKPVAYQTLGGRKQAVACSYVLHADKSVGLQVGLFDPAQPLVIDPIIEYSEITADDVMAMQVDAAGEVYLTGIGSGDFFIEKLNATADALIYSTRIPLNSSYGINTVYALALDGSGNAYVSAAMSPSFPTTTTLATPTCTACNVGLVAKFGTDGTMQYSSFLSPDGLQPRAITVDGSGDLYIVGSGNGTLQMVNPFQSTPNAAFFAKLDSTGSSFLFSSYFGPAGATYFITPVGIALDSSGNIFLAGNTQGTVPLVNPWNKLGRVFLSKFTPDGQTLLFSTLLDPITLQEIALVSMAVGSDGTVYLAGDGQSDDFPFPYTVNAAAHQLAFSQFGTYAMAINPTLTGVTYATYLGEGQVTALAVDSHNNLYVGVDNAGPSPLAFQNAVVTDVTSGGHLVELDPTGAPVLVTEFGGHYSAEVPSFIAVDSSSNIYVAGQAIPSFASQVFPYGPDPVLVFPPKGPIFTQLTGGNFIAKINRTNGPQLSVTSPVSLIFTNNLPNQTPYLFVKNTGSADLHISNIALSGGVSLKVTNCGSTIPAGGSCVLTALASNGGEVSGSVTITSDATPSVQTFPVSVGATFPSSPIGDLPWYQDVYFAFPPQFNGTSSNNIGFTIWNLGFGTTTVNSVQAEVTAQETNNCNTPLSPGADCTIQTGFMANSSVNGTPGLSYTVDGFQSYAIFSAPISPQQLLLSTSSVFFGQQQVNGVALERTVTVTNTSNASVSAPSVSLTGEPQFVISDNTCHGSLLPHQSCVVGAQFFPVIDGDLQATLAIGGQSVTLYGAGYIASAVQISPFELDFSSVTVGGTYTQNLTLTNSFSAPVGIAGVAISNPDYSENSSYSATGSCAGVVPANGTCLMQFQFQPQVLGSDNGTVTISFNGGVPSQIFSVEGIGLSPMSLTPTVLNFGSVALNTTSASQNVSIGNDLFSPLSYTVSVTGDFAIDLSYCKSPIPANVGCAVPVTFHPNSLGTQQGSITFSFTGYSVQTVLTLNGTGVPPASALSVPSSLDFGSQAFSLSIEKDIVLNNTGSTTLYLNNFSISGTNANEFQVPSGQCSSIAAGTSCTVQAYFSPGQYGGTGTVSATLQIFDNAQNSPQSIALTGTVIPYILQFISSSSTTLSSGQTAQYQLSIATQGSPVLQFTCTGAPQNATCSVPASVNTANIQTISVTVATGVSASSKLVKTNTVFYAAFVFVPFLLGFKFRKYSRGITLCLAVCMATIWIGCGGGGGSSGSSGGTSTPTPTPTPTPVVSSATPVGTYTLTLTASGNGFTESIPFTLIVH